MKTYVKGSNDKNTVTEVVNTTPWSSHYCQDGTEKKIVLAYALQIYSGCLESKFHAEGFIYSNSYSKLHTFDVSYHETNMLRLLNFKPSDK